MSSVLYGDVNYDCLGYIIQGPVRENVNRKNLI